MDNSEKAKLLMFAIITKTNNEKRKPNQAEQDLYYILQEYLQLKSKEK